MEQRNETSLTIQVMMDDDGSFIAQVIELPGCFASGQDLEELQEALEEAIECYLSTDSVTAKVRGLDLRQLRLFDEDTDVPASVELALA